MLFSIVKYCYWFTHVFRIINLSPNQPYVLYLHQYHQLEGVGMPCIRKHDVGSMGDKSLQEAAQGALCFSKILKMGKNKSGLQYRVKHASQCTSMAKGFHLAFGRKSTHTSPRYVSDKIWDLFGSFELFMGLLCWSEDRTTKPVPIYGPKASKCLFNHNDPPSSYWDVTRTKTKKNPCECGQPPMLIFILISYAQNIPWRIYIT